MTGPTPEGHGIDAISPGTEVEMTANFAAIDAAKIHAYRALGNKRPPGLVNDRDCFGVSIGEKARVIDREGDAFQVKILGGTQKGRIGWVAIDAVRVPPSEAESSTEVVDGLALLVRRQVYAAINQAGFAATAEAGALYPFDRMPTDAEAAREYLEERKAVYEAARLQGFRDVQSRFRIDAGQLARIEAEGDEKRWPSWDGLADDQGPIPSFGPARTDGHGRIVMDQVERKARQDASIRALGVIGRITNETDTDEVWERVARGFEGAH